MKKQHQRPTEKELEILSVLWEEGPSTVKQVHELMGNTTGYTTTLKIMQIMSEKGLVNREKEGRIHIYSAVASAENTGGELLNRLKNMAFGGSSMRLVMGALGNSKSSKQELREIREYIEKLEKGEE
ncbi:MAG: BlaI/MecI/CopY family transcriptional regulator [Cyclobacteriaceae bacterium]|nr:BlaI/MecI/CopY family transcriptional regulator [Cyclobacteriaceae bacterium]